MSVEKHLEQMLKESEDQAESLQDEGHIKLMSDLTAVWKMAKEGKYHDFHRNGFDAPKVSLVQILNELKENAMNGMYDN